jgi:hypothetical protein
VAAALSAEAAAVSDSSGIMITELTPEEAQPTPTRQLPNANR